MNFKNLAFITKIFKADITKNTSILVFGTVAAQAIPLLLQPILRRYFDTEVFGAYSVYSSILAILVVATSLRYEQAIVLPESEDDAANLVLASLGINLVSSILLFAVIFIFQDSALRLINLEAKYAIFLYLLPVGVFLHGSYQNFYFWLVRKKDFRAISINKLVRRGFEGTFHLIFAFSRKTFGLVYGDIIGNVANLLLLIKKSYNNGLRLTTFNIQQSIRALNRYSDFPKYSLIPAVLASCNYFLPTIFINKFYGTNAAGYFDLSKMLLSVPLALVGSALASVLLQRYAQMYRERKSFVHELKILFGIIAFLAIVEIAIIWWLGVDIFTIFFGENWAYSGELSKILVWSYALNFVVSSFSGIFIALERIKLYSIWQIIYFILLGSLVFVSYIPFEKFIHLFVFIEIISYTLVLVAGVYIIISYEKKIKNMNVNI